MHRIGPTAIVLVLAPVAWALDGPRLPPLLPRDREIGLARSAGLEPWVDHATIYVLKRGGYEIALRGSNGFSCLVGHDGPDTSWPICWDPEGTETILPRILREAELVEQGKTQEEVDLDSAGRFRDGTYRAPRRPGISYMLSRENRLFDGEKVRWFPPHLMFYAPYMTNQDVGAVRGEFPRSPLVLYSGTPHAYLIAVVSETMPQQPAND